METRVIRVLISDQSLSRTDGGDKQIAMRSIRVVDKPHVDVERVEREIALGEDAVHFRIGIRLDGCDTGRAIPGVNESHTLVQVALEWHVTTVAFFCNNK